MGFSYIYTAKLFCIDNDTRGLSNAFPFLNTNSVSLSRVSTTFYARERQNIGNRKNTVMQLNTSTLRVFKPLSRNFYSSFFHIYTHTRSFSISSLNNSINKNFKFSKVLFILPSKSLSLSPFPKNPLT